MKQLIKNISNKGNDLIRFQKIIVVLSLIIEKNENENGLPIPQMAT